MYEDQGQIKRKIYKLAEYREKKTKDLDQVRCIKDEEEKVLVTNKDIKERWDSYFYKFFNHGQGLGTNMEELKIQDEERSWYYYRRIPIREVKESLKRMEKGKVVGPDGIHIEVWKCMGNKVSFGSLSFSMRF